MNKYQVNYQATTHGSIEVDADNKMQAEDKVWNFLEEHGIPALTETNTDYLIDFSELVE